MSKDKVVAATEPAKTVAVDEALTSLETDALAQAQSFFEKGIATELYPEPETETEPKAEVEPEKVETPENTEETETTAAAEPEKVVVAEDEDESLDVLSKMSDEELDTLGKEKEWDASYVRRVKKFTRQLREAQEQTASVRSELDAAKAIVPTQAPAQSQSPLASIETAEQLESEKAKVEDVLANVERLRRRARRDPEGVARTLIENKVSVADSSIESVEDALDSVEDGANTLLRKALPARGRFLGEVHRNIGQALTEFPELKDSKSKLTIAANAELQRAPHLKLSADWPLVALNLALGRMKSQELKEAKVKPTPPVPKPNPPKIPSTPKAAPTKLGPNANAQSLKTKAFSTGKEADVARYLESQLT